MRAMKRPLVGWIAFCILAFPSVCLLGYLALSSVVPELASSPTSISPPSVPLVPHTTNTPASRTTITRTFTPPKEGLARRAAQGKQQKPKPVTWTGKIKPPEALQMPAKTQVTMGEIWNGTLEVVNQYLSYPGFQTAAQTSSVAIGSLGGGVSVVNGGGWMSGQETWVYYEWVSGGPLDPKIFNCYLPFVVTASCAGDMESQLVYLYIGQVELASASPALPAGATTVSSLAIDVSLSVSGLYLKRGRSASVPPDRQVMDWSDLNASDAWYADDSTTVTVTATGPGGINLSATGSLGYTPGQEVEIGSSYILSAAISMNNAPTASTPYAAITGINWGGTTINAVKDLYNPGDADGIPSVDISPWSRTQNTNNCYHVYDYNDGFAIEHLQGTSGAGNVALKWSAPKILTLTPIDGMFDKQGPSYDIEYTSTPITWTSTTEYEATKFSAPISVAEYPTNFEYEYEYKKLSGNTITVTVTDDWRTLNGEDVSNDGGAVTAAYNDQLCGILLLPLTATDCIADPWWQPGINLTHRPSTDINDTEGQARRASWWLGGAGVAIDPTDNDKWTVEAGATAPAVSRSLRTRYWLRMERLAEWLDDPEAEHNADWPIMLKANLAISETLDDPDWWAEETNWSPSGTYSEGRIDIYEGVSCSGECDQFTQRFFEQTFGVVFPTGGPKGSGEWWEQTHNWQVNHTPETVVYVSGGTDWHPGDAVLLWDFGMSKLHAGILHSYDTGAWWYANSNNNGDSLGYFGNITTQGLTILGAYRYVGEGVLIEDIWNWANYRYLLLSLTAPRNATLRLTVAYSVPAVADPCYTGFAYRFGDWADLFGGWEYTKSAHTLTWDIDVSAGAGTYLVDFCLNREGVTPTVANRMQVVSGLTLTLPANESESAENWELTGLELVEDPGEPGRAEPNTHFVARFKPSWSWLDPNFNDDSEDAVHAPMNWFGFGGIIDGLDCLEIDYGYNTSFGQTGNEHKLLYIQYAQHNPLSEATGLIHSAKALGRWHNELSWQEGFDITWPGTDPLNASENQDADQGQVDSAMYWWDLAQSDEETDWTDTSIALCAGSYQMASGVAYDVRFHKYPRGALHGIALSDAAHTMCYRNTSNCVYIFGGKQGAIGLLGIEDTDEHGRFRYDEAREDEWTYAVRVSPLSVPTQPTICSLTAVNRSYTSVVVAWGDWPAWLSATPASFQAIGLLNSEPGGDVYYRAQNWGRGWERPGAVPMSTTVGGFGSLTHDPASWEFYALHQLGVSTYLQVSERFGGQWKTEFPNVVGFVGGQGVIVNSRVYSLGSISSFYYLARQRLSDGALLGPLNLVGTGAGVPGSITRHDATGVLWAALPLGDDTLIYVSVDDGSSWTHVETVDCQYGTVVSVAHKMLVAGYMPLVVGGANGIVKVTTLDVNTGARVGQPLTVARADWPKCALVYQPSEGFIHLFTIKDNDWTTDTWTPRYSYTPGLLASYERVPCGSSNGAFTQLFGERRLGLTFDEHWNDAYTTWINPALHPYWCTQTPYTGSEVVQPGDLVVSNYGGWWYTSVYHGEVGGVPHHVHCGYPGVPQGVLTPMVDPVIGWYRRQYTPSIVEWVSDDDAETFVQTRIIPRV